MSTIIDGRQTREELTPILKKKVEALGFTPTFAIIQVGNRPDSMAFIQGKKKFAANLGVNTKHIQVPESVSQTELISKIVECNNDKSVQGIIVQLPISEHLNRTEVINAIDPKKDADGLTAVNVKLLAENSSQGMIPATARGVRELLAKYNIGLKGKNVVVVGRSDLVGKPISIMALNEGATVTVCHSQTVDLKADTTKADVLIVAIGKPCFIGADYIKKGAVVVDIGINTLVGEKLEDEIQNRVLVGDVDFDAVFDKVSAITPVPGGVGPMTVLALFENLVDLCVRM